MNMELNDAVLALFGYTREMLLDTTITLREVFFEQLWDNEKYPLTKWASPTICMGGINQGNPQMRILRRQLYPPSQPVDEKAKHVFDAKVSLVCDFWYGMYAVMEHITDFKTMAERLDVSVTPELMKETEKHPENMLFLTYERMQAMYPVILFKTPHFEVRQIVLSFGERKPRDGIAAMAIEPDKPLGCYEVFTAFFENRDEASEFINRDGVINAFSHYQVAVKHFNHNFMNEKSYVERIPRYLPDPDLNVLRIF